MKFQNCISISFERTHGRTEGRTDALTVGYFLDNYSAISET